MNSENIIIIAAKNKHRVIGKNGQIPWSLKSDLRFFKKTTWSHSILMGRKTFNSICNNPLPYRNNIIITRDRKQFNLDIYDNPIVKIHENLYDALDYYSRLGLVFICGGQSIYEECMQYASKMILTNVINNRVGDTYFPKINKKEWKLHKTLENNWQTEEEFLIEDKYTVTEWIRK